MIKSSFGYHFQDLDLLSKETIEGILDDAYRRKKNRLGSPKGSVDKEQPLKGYTLAMVFHCPSTRTRLSFQMAMKHLGGSCLILDADVSQISRGESLVDTVRLLERYADIIMVRCQEHALLLDVLKHVSVPTINGLTNHSHPCQVLADVMTLQEHLGSLENKTVAWVGAFTNVTRSWMHMCFVMGWSLQIACPPSSQSKEALLWLETYKISTINLTSSPQQAIKNACCVITDTWHSMGENASKDASIFLPFQVNETLMEQASEECLVMHCLPAHHGEEITKDVFERHHHVIFDEAENRVHVQKAILCDIIKQQ